ncbi:MAG TPA: FliH/SctL family protein [Myxococcota bacterium]|nr:FliH/SctL family protein [Myxococcota bacterium]
MPARIIPAAATANMNIRPARNNLLFAERLRAQQEAAEIIEAAKRSAQAIEDRKRDELETALEAARQEGRSRGYREIASQAAELVRMGKTLDLKLTCGAIDLAKEMCRRILRREIALRPESVGRICEGVISENRPGRMITIFVHPEDAEIVRGLKTSLSGDPAVEVKIESSGRIERGGCIVRGELGEVDGRLSVQIDELAKVMREGLQDA